QIDFHGGILTRLDFFRLTSRLGGEQFVERELCSAFRAARVGQAGEIVPAMRTDDGFALGGASALGALFGVLAPYNARRGQPAKRRQACSDEPSELVLQLIANGANTNGKNYCRSRCQKRPDYT